MENIISIKQENKIIEKPIGDNGFKNIIISYFQLGMGE